MSHHLWSAPSGLFVGLGLLLATAPSLSSCKGSGEQQAADCEPAAPVKAERVSLGRVGDADNRDNDWCRACVWSDRGFASCQRVFAAGASEERETVRARARAKACKDAGWPADGCPDEKVISLICKGDAVPEGTENPGAALQQLYRKLNPEKFHAVAPPDAGNPPDAGSPAAAPVAE